MPTCDLDGIPHQLIAFPEAVFSVSISSPATGSFTSVSHTQIAKWVQRSVTVEKHFQISLAYGECNQLLRLDLLQGTSALPSPSKAPCWQSKKCGLACYFPWPYHSIRLA